MKTKAEVMRDLGRVANKRIKFTISNDGADADGFPLDGQTIFRECWSSVRGLRGREYFSAAQVQAQETKVFRCRYFEGLKTEMNIEMDGKLYNIQSINNLNEQNAEYEIHASEVTGSE